jgi:aarF domain-containing kinase
MKGTSGWACFFRATAGTRPSYAQSVLHKSPKVLNRRAYATASSVSSSNTSRVRLYVAGGLVVAGATALTVNHQAQHAWTAAQRTGRVLVTLALNINDYRATLKQYHVLSEYDYQLLLKLCHKRCAERTLIVLQKNGSIFVKLGQHLSSMNYLLPNEWCDTFIPLQDQCPVSSMESVEAMVLKDTGNTLSHYFSHFETIPIGAASLAQVHRATLRDTGEHVAVKVQHPALDEWAALDLALTRFTFRTLKRFFPEYDLTWLSDEMDESLPKELDFALEGYNAERARKYFDKVAYLPVIIPKVHWAQRRILVMDYVTGRRPDDLPYLDANNIDRDEVSAALARIFNEMIFGTDAPLHCDPHGGNIAIRLNKSRRAPRNFDVVLYDHGLYRVPDNTLRRNYAKLWLAVLDADEPRMRKYAKELAGISDELFPIRICNHGPRLPRRNQKRRHMQNRRGKRSNLGCLGRWHARTASPALRPSSPRHPTHPQDQRSHAQFGREFTYSAGPCAHVYDSCALCCSCCL